MNMEEKSGGNPAPASAGEPILSPSPEYGRYSAASKTRIPVPFTKTDSFFAVLLFLCGYLFIWLVHPFHPGFGVTLFTILFCTTAFFYVGRRNRSVPLSSYFWLAVIFLSGLNFSLFSNSFLQFFNLLFLMGCAAYWVAVMTGGRMEKKVGPLVLADLFHQLFRVPFLNFGCGQKVIRETAVKNKKGKVLLASLAGALAILPIFFIVLSLLMQADGTFQDMVEQFSESIGDHLVRFLLRLLPAYLVGSYFFGLLYGNIQKRRTDSITAEKVEQFSEKSKRIPAAAVATALILLCVLYLFFFGAQTAALAAAFSAGGPQGITVAEFARRGFFELCEVVTINFAVLVLSNFFTRKKDSGSRILKVTDVILSVETLLLIATALSKMFLYINRYGLTPKRVYTSWFMIVLAIIFLLILVSSFKKIPLARSIAVTFILSFLLLCYANVDGTVIKYNVERYRNGTLGSVDVSMMYQSPDAAKPYAIELYQSTKDLSLKLELRSFLQFQNGDALPFQEMNLQRLSARRMELF